MPQIRRFPAGCGDLDGGGDDVLLRRDKAEALAVQRLEIAAHEAGLRQRHGKRRVGAAVAEVHEAFDGDGVVLDALVEQLFGRRAAELVSEIFQIAHGGGVERSFDRTLAAGALRRQAHAVSRQQTRQRMHQHGLDAERIGDQAGMLAAGRAETVEGILRHIVAALDRHLLDGVGHVLDGDADAAVGDLFRCAAVAHFAREIGKRGAHRVGIERLIVAGRRKSAGRNSRRACRA